MKSLWSHCIPTFFFAEVSAEGLMFVSWSLLEETLGPDESYESSNWILYFETRNTPGLLWKNFHLVTLGGLLAAVSPLALFAIAKYTVGGIYSPQQAE